MTRWHTPSRLTAGGLVIASGLVAFCGGPTLPATSTVSQPPGIVCPIPPTPVVTTNGQPALVTYAAPTITGGTAPVSLSCTPPSGSTFPVGATLTTCTATDAVRRTASCSFSVTVTLPVPRLGVTTILAFGDSITEGEVPVVGESRVRPRYVEPERSYPADLTALLAQRYTGQGASRVDAFTLASTNETDCDTNPPGQRAGC